MDENPAAIGRAQSGRQETRHSEAAIDQYQIEFPIETDVGNAVIFRPGTDLLFSGRGPPLSDRAKIDMNKVQTMRSNRLADPLVRFQFRDLFRVRVN
jgi:hypothetical protein